MTTPTTADTPAAPPAGGGALDLPDSKILALLAIASAAREWASDRNPEDWSERALFVALFDAFPQDFPGRENCGCDQSGMACDECPSIHEIRAAIRDWRPDLNTAIRNWNSAHVAR